MNQHRIASIALLLPALWAAATNPAADVRGIHSGDGLPQAYDGSGITVAFIDQGFDPNHIAFTVPGNPSQSRVRAFYLWSSPRFDLKALADVTTDYTGDYHGTHVAGIAAAGYDGPGRYNDGAGVKDYSSLPLQGVAPGAGIVMAGAGPTLSASMLQEGLNKMKDYAAASGRPMVLNLSLGDILGSHSGSGANVTGGSALPGYLDGGAIVCIASGNTGTAKCCVRVEGEGAKCVGLPFTTAQKSSYIYTTPRLKDGYTEFTTTSSCQGIDVEFIVYDSEEKQICYSRSLADIYRDPQKSVGGSSTAMLGCAVNADFDKWFSADSYIRVFSCNMSGTNGPQLKERSEWVYNLGTQLKGSDSPRYLPGLYIHCRSGEKAFGYTTGGEFKSYSAEACGTFPAWTGGTADGSMAALATIDNAICVGACSATERTGYLNGNSYAATYRPGEIWPMSSYGYNTFTGERLPHVVAPGYSVVSAMNRYCNDPYNAFCATAEQNGTTCSWKDATGTSMASPFVAGTIALWLQANPDLTVGDIKDVFKATNTYPEEILALPDDDERRLQWGGGMIQPLAGLKYILGNYSGLSAPAADRVLVEQYDSEIRVSAPGDGPVSTRLHTLSGMAVAGQEASGSEAVLSTGGLPRGLYILEVRTSSGSHARKIRL